MVTPALAVSRFGVHELGDMAHELYANHARERARVSAMQSLAPGDRAIMSQHGSMYRPAGLLSGAGRLWNAKTPAAIEPRIVGQEPPAPPPASLRSWTSATPSPASRSFPP
jgi:hypothetical protein